MQGLEELRAALAERFGEDFCVDLPPGAADRLAGLAAHRVTRAFTDDPLDPTLVRLLCACALSAPSKSDLQQRDIVIVSDPGLRARIADLVPGLPWLRRAPGMAVFCINGRRLPQIAEWRGKPFPNDHFDLLFNGIGDAAIALAWFQAALAMAGLGGCPVSEIRNHAEAVSEWLGLPDKVVPYAGFCFGRPAEAGAVTPRLPLDVTVHENRFSEENLEERIAAHDARREVLRPYSRQRGTRRFGTADGYGWSEDKARQYAEPLRGAFGDFVRGKGFRLD